MKTADAQFTKAEMKVPLTAVEFPATAASKLKSSPRWKGFFIAASILIIGFIAPLRDLLQFAMHDELYSYIPLIPAVSIYFALQQRKNLQSFSKPWSVTAAICLTIGAATLALFWFNFHRTSLTPENYLAFTTFAFLSFLIAATAWFLGRQILCTLIFPLSLLVFMIPLPGIARQWTEIFLQYGSAATANVFFKLAGMPVFQDGLQFQLPGINLQVAPECSGIHSSLVLLITGIIAAKLFLRGPWSQFTLVLAIIPLALLRNGFRIFVIGELCVRRGPEMLDSSIHHHGGPLFFILSLLPLLALLFFLQRREGNHSNPKI